MQRRIYSNRSTTPPLVNKRARFRSVLVFFLFLGLARLAWAAPIHDAIAAGDTAKVKSLVAADPSVVNSQADNGATPLMYAIHFGNVDVVKFLLNRGAVVDAKAGSTGETALLSAAANGQLEVVKLLLDKRASVNTQNNSGATPLLLASENGQLEVVKLLLDKGASVNSAAHEASMHDGATPLIGATKTSSDYQAELEGSRATSADPKHGYLEIVKLLLGKGARVNAKDNFGATALVYASENGQLEVVRLLLENGAAVDAKANNGNTPLYYASQNHQLEVVKLLLAKGAIPLIQK